MEDKMAWRRVHAELVEDHRLAQDMNGVLAKTRACCNELLSCLATDGDGSADIKDKTEGDAHLKVEVKY